MLKLMRKGTTAFRNIELLKWCKEYGVKPYWNLLYGFPGEDIADYDETVALIRTIWHLDPPTGYGPIRMHRFSPYHADPAAFGMTNVRPMTPFTYLYPFETRKLMNIAYYFDFDYADGRADDAYAQAAIDLTRAWMADGDRGMLEGRSDTDASLELFDTRSKRAGTPRRAMLHGWKAAVFLACDRAQPFGSLASLTEVRAEGVRAEDLRAFLDRCVGHELMVSNGQAWLNVAVHVPAREDTHASTRAAQKSREFAVVGSEC